MQGRVPAGSCHTDPPSLGINSGSRTALQGHSPDLNPVSLLLSQEGSVHMTGVEAQCFLHTLGISLTADPLQAQGPSKLCQDPVRQVPLGH